MRGKGRRRSEEDLTLPASLGWGMRRQILWTSVYSGENWVLDSSLCWPPPILHFQRENVLESESESRSVLSDSLWPYGLYSPWNSLGQNTGVGSLSLLQGIFPTPWVKPKSPPLQTDSLPAKPQGKPKNTGVDSLSLLQQIFPTQESNRGLLHHGQILYQLSYQGSPSIQ